MTTRLICAAACLIAQATPVQAKGPLLRFSFAKDPDYTVVMARGPHGEDVATINEIRFLRPVIYPAPDYDNAVIAGDVDQSQDFGDYDTIIYVRLRRTGGQHWDVLLCKSIGLYRVPREGVKGPDSVSPIARAAFVRALKARRPIPGEKCQPAREIQKGSRTY